MIMRRMVISLARALAVLGAGAVAGLAVNAVRPHGLPLTVAIRSQAESGTAACGAGGADQAHPDRPDYVPIECQEAALLLGQPGVAFVDLRPASSCLEGHVTSACRLDGDTPAEAALATLGAKKTIILYGSAASCEPVLSAARALHAHGCDDVRLLQGGFDAWMQASEPAASGACDDCSVPVSLPPAAGTPPVQASLVSGRGT
jgi:rhodanese-related sulfurtransferase